MADPRCGRWSLLVGRTALQWRQTSLRAVYLGGSPSFYEKAMFVVAASRQDYCMHETAMSDECGCMRLARETRHVEVLL